MKFSFVIPAYNEEGYLDGCIESIKAQNAGRYEIIVCYSPSSDRTLEIAKRHGVKIVTIPKSCPGKARNAGARAATGEYLVFLDADVQIPGNFLRSTIKHVRRGCVAVGYRSEWRDGDGLLDIFNEVVTNPFSKYAKVLFVCCTIKKSAFEKTGGYDENITANEEWGLSKRLKSLGRIVFDENAPIKSSARRFHKLGKLRTFAVYSSWFLMGHVLGRDVRYFHLSDMDRRADVSHEA
ncbi:MAG: glycosyltransferase [Candidatus Aenigmarchaeota archaeon]|nr:glycosyltransferase [Candidatus Aenigmarchaeota archaeon]